jgi:hypothetical protein
MAVSLGYDGPMAMCEPARVRLAQAEALNIAELWL